MRRRKWWFIGLGAVIVAACVIGLAELSSDSITPAFLRQFGSKVRIIERKPILDPGSRQLAIIEWYSVDNPAEDVVVALADVVGGRNIRPSGLGVSTGDQKLGYFVSASGRETYVQKWELRHVSPFDSWVGDRWHGWIKFRFGPILESGSAILDEASSPQRELDYDELRKRRASLFPQRSIADLY